MVLTYDAHLSIWEYRVVWRRRFEAGDAYGALSADEQRTFDQLSRVGFPGSTQELIDCVLALG
jgi:hypothetical protein